ncbi:alpha/beta fold hydrolase [Polyangium spumosum]|uniref:Alpha/beta fold hydrolase n=1 Tax=Polyangium spumosum TaxID=889282 RepID=A0A6N7PW28_9BACT|nr:alpha/beta hydrolase [Polyangium spumosum]MRG95046.1 alpha/beta fold hydrolase [Polyangium spumosum]
MPHVELNGQNIFYEDTGGEGPPVVLAHGFLMDLSMFDPQVSALAPELRVIRFDARGFGRTQSDGKRFTYWDSAEDYIRLLDHLGVERAVVGGMSQGGFLGLRAALKWPDRVKGLVLISTQAGVDDAATLAGYRGMLETWRAQGPIDPIVHTIAGLILGAREHWEPWVSRWRKTQVESLVAPTLALIEREDLTARLSEIPHPAIVFHGDADTAISIERGRALASSLPGCKAFVEVKGAAHASNLTHPDQVNPPLLAFLREYA